MRSGCTKTVFTHNHSTVENVAKEPVVRDVQSAAGGVVLSRQVNATDEGTFDVSEEVRTELPVKSAVVEKRRTLRALVKTVTHRNQGSVAPLPSGIGSSARSELTDGGLYNQTITTVTARPGAEIAKACSKTAFEHQDSSTSNVSTAPESKVESASQGVTNQRQVRATDEGTFDVTDTKTTELEQSRAVVEKQRTTHGLVTTTTNKAVRTVVDPLLNIGESFTKTLTPGACHDTVHREVTVDASDYRKWEAEVSLNHLYSKTVWFENATESQYKQLITDLQNLADNQETTWVARHRPPSSIRVSPEVRHTEVDRFDGQVNFTASWSPQSAGQTGSTDDIFVQKINEGYEIDNKSRYIRSYNTYTACGRGLKKLEQLMTASVVGGTIDISFSFQHDETWTLQRKILGAWTKITIGTKK